MSKLQIQDSRTRFCIADMRHNGGIWDAAKQAWIFANEAAAANALAMLYRRTRASAGQRVTLAEMTRNGTGRDAWGSEANLDERAAATLDREQASGLIAQGMEARRVLGSHPLEDQPLRISSDLFDTSAFEAGVQARRNKLRRR